MVRSALTPVAALVIVAAMLLALAASTASAMSSASYKVVLTRNGYESTVGRTIDIPGFSVDGGRLPCPQWQDGQSDHAEYASYAALSKDWIAGTDTSRAARRTDAFDGRVLYWNTDSVLVVDFERQRRFGGEGGRQQPGPPPSRAAQRQSRRRPAARPRLSGLPSTGGKRRRQHRAVVVMMAMVAGVMLATGATMVIQGVRVRR
jgi:hypothetical protein